MCNWALCYHLQIPDRLGAELRRDASLFENAFLLQAAPCRHAPLAAMPLPSHHAGCCLKSHHRYAKTALLTSQGSMHKTLRIECGLPCRCTRPRD